MLKNYIFQKLKINLHETISIIMLVTTKYISGVLNLCKHKKNTES